MKDNDKALLEKIIVDAERQTRAQIVMAVTRRSDNYCEIPWKAFAFGTSVTGLIVLFLDMFFPVWITGTTVFLSLTAIFITGAFLAILTVLLPGFARLFLASNRRETEPLQYAESLFLSNELFRTKGRRGILLFVSCFERQVIILPDTGVRDRLNEPVMKNIITGMKPDLRQNKLKNAMEAGLKGIVTALRPPLSDVPDDNELPDKIIEKEGI